jgi:hypothetical protein
VTSSSSVSLRVPSLVSRNAAADLFGRTAGEIVKSVSNDDMDREEGVCGVEGVMDDIAAEEDVRVRAWMMSCFSLAF